QVLQPNPSNRAWPATASALSASAASRGGTFVPRTNSAKWSMSANPSASGRSSGSAVVLPIVVTSFGRNRLVKPIEAVIDATSVDTGVPKRDAHLRSSDFLDVEHHPSIRFRSTRIDKVTDDHWKVTGDLTLLA